MNKRFYTLMAGVLLAGGVLSNASAEELSTVANNGKYYKMQRGALYDFSQNKWTKDEGSPYFLDMPGKKAKAGLTKDANDYWKVDQLKNGTYRLTSFEGEVLALDKVKAFGFYNKDFDQTEAKGFTQLSFNAGKNFVANSSTENASNSGFYELMSQVSDATNSGIAFDAVDEIGGDVTSDMFMYDLKKGDINAVRFAYHNGVGEYGIEYAYTKIFKVSYDETTKTYSFKYNQGDGRLVIGDTEDFKVEYDELHGVYLTDADESSYVKINGNKFVFVNSKEEATAFGFELIEDDWIPAEALNVLEKDGFSVTIYHDSKDDDCFEEDHLATNIAGNPFKGHLQTMVWSSEDKKFYASEDESEDAADAAKGDNDSFYLKNSDGEYIVAQEYEGEGGDAYEKLYGFTTVSEKTLIHDLTKAAMDGIKYEQKYFGEFKAKVNGVDYDADKNAITKVNELTSLFVVVPDPERENSSYYASVGRYDFTTKKVPTLVASMTTSLKDIFISLGDREIVDWTKFVQGKFFTIEKTKTSIENGAVGKLAVKDNADGYAWVGSYGNDLEGQWALTVEFSDAPENTKAAKYVFTNRENTNKTFTLTAQTLYYGSSEDTYKQSGETYVIKAVETTDADGYARLDVKDEKNQKWNIAFSSGVFGTNAYLTENHKDGEDFHLVGLDINVENALQFTIKQYAGERTIKEDEKTHLDVYTPTDTIYVISILGTYNAKKEKYEPVEDTLKVLSYSFVNQWNEPLTFGAIDKIGNNAYRSEVYYKEDDKTKKYADASLEKAHADAQKFTVRLDGEKCYNLRPVAFCSEDEAMFENELPENWEELMYQEFNNKSEDKDDVVADLVKMYTGNADKGILDNEALYDRTENDLFVIVPTETEIYRRLANEVDTVSIYRQGAENSLLYEKTTEIAKDQFVNFLGLENIAEYTKMAPAMLADTAYVRYETYKPQYMLVVEPTIVPAGNYCPIHGVNATCEHAVPTKGWTSGRYLVNLVDSAKAWDEAHKHQAGNPYKNVEGFYKLGFVQATHKNDTLAIAAAEPVKADSIFVGNNDNANGKYAFKYVDTEAKSFVIETTLDGSKTPGYLKWMNGVVVAVDNIKYADVYNMNEDEDRTPTANDEIAASEVSIIAANGSIIVKGAAGKTVAISNILGQTIANAVVSSDNETIAVPAGIAVVAVEGEEAVKVVVK